MELLGELFSTGLTMYLLSFFIALFDGKNAKMLRMIAYLNGIAIVIIVGASVGAYGTNLLKTLDNLSKWKPF